MSDIVILCPFFWAQWVAKSPQTLQHIRYADLAQVILKSHGQVAAGLSVTRSFGDVDFKVPAEVVTAVPELSAFAIDPEAGCGGDLEVTSGGAVGRVVCSVVSTDRDSRFDYLRAKPNPTYGTTSGVIASIFGYQASINFIKL